MARARQETRCGDGFARDTQADRAAAPARRGNECAVHGEESAPEAGRDGPLARQPAAPASMLADSAYGDVGAFRDGVRALGFEYALDVKSHTRVVIVCDDGEETDPMNVETVADIIGAKCYRKVTWRQGSRRALAARFATVRVRVVTGRDVRGEEQWLIIEKPSRSAPPEHFVLATLPKSMSRKELVRCIKQRWRTERAYEDLKGELGLDHFEGRTYTGWQHHVSCTLACFAFLVAERARVFPPAARRTRLDDPIARAA